MNVLENQLKIYLAERKVGKVSKSGRNNVLYTLVG